MLYEADDEGHPGEAIVFVTMYEPGVLAPKFICPVDEFKAKPGADVKVPGPLPLGKVGEGFAPP